MGAYDSLNYGNCLRTRERYEGDHVQLRGFGTLIKTVIHTAINWIDRLPRRSRYRLGFIVKVLSCPGCNGRQVWIDRHFAYTRWHWPWRRNRVQS